MKYLSHYIIFGALIFSGVLSYAFYKKSIAEERKILENASYNIVNSWELPTLLDEVSGIAWVNDSTIACIQDEDGVIYNFNINTGEISNDIIFAEGGDYEAIALNENDAYVMRSDGRIFEIKSFASDAITPRYFDTSFGSKNNMESLTYNPKTNSLITVAKDKGLAKDRYKGLYSIPLETKIQDEKPLFKIDMQAKEFEAFRSKKEEKTFNPSDMAIHPKTGEYYIVDGKKPKLLILSPTGKIKIIHELNKFHFAQPESITFSPNGTLYIANEAADGVATLLEVTLKK
ncbi:hypothetical protein [Leeuwenhoekiella marinoflava]|uniref:SdiA-regulated protein n=2 Tax=Leeuwenhoekiella marinoflava TaxID=988 RepID=A0A4Q0PGB9_9FLAO|nr:hypothetical protein [Leeuwenhoekiella marinoflava]RXG25913.1 hypothetical protein DSL99_3457 [Leeuwenhoekiella marinoflava]SHF28537.1 hypothetical protein SAMN02745246_02140 [Leeuwenhoekiella marinoflava DSM 3653]